MYETPDLSSSFHPQPKPSKRVKESRVKKWNKGRSKIKETFEENGVTNCEIYPFVMRNRPHLLKSYKFSDCKKNNFLGFAHTRLRVKLTEDEITDHRFVVLSDQSCHYIIDFIMPKAEAEDLLDSIVANRGW